MITQIEIDGFKTFKDFKVELAPFQVIVGPNGSGKSNLFDALQLLSKLAEFDVQTAFQAPHDDPQKLRGDASELFTLLPNGQHTEHIHLAVEMLIDRHIQDDLGGEAELRFRRLRYELKLALHEYQSRPSVEQESLKSIPLDGDSWLKRYIPSPQIGIFQEIANRQEIFIETNHPEPQPISESKIVILQKSTISLRFEGAESGTTRHVTASKARRTVLSSVTDITFPHAFAAHEELRSFHFLHLNPEALRRSSPVNIRPFLSPDGSNLPTTLVRMEAEDKFALTDLSRDMANLVPSIFKMSVKKNEASDEYNIFAETSDGRSFPAQVLSDGTLRLLAIATLRNDPKFHGVLCMEEPENGVDTLHLQNMTRLLCEMATDFTDPQQTDDPLRQVLITTHSPTFISQTNVIDSLLLTLMPTHIQGKNTQPLRITKMVPVSPASTLSQSETGVDRDKKIEIYTIDMVRKYLTTENLDEALNQLQKARDRLIQ